MQLFVNGIMFQSNDEIPQGQLLEKIYELEDGQIISIYITEVNTTFLNPYKEHLHIYRINRAIKLLYFDGKSNWKSDDNKIDTLLEVIKKYYYGYDNWMDKIQLRPDGKGFFIGNQLYNIGVISFLFFLLLLVSGSLFNIDLLYKVGMKLPGIAFPFLFLSALFAQEIRIKMLLLTTSNLGFWAYTLFLGLVSLTNIVFLNMK